MPVYMLLSYLPADVGDGPRRKDDSARWATFTDELLASGLMLCGEALLSRDEAVMVSRRDDVLSVEEGRGSGGEQVLGGYYLIDAPDRDTAIEWAARVPSAEYGAVEVRPVEQGAAADPDTIRRLHDAQRELAAEYRRVLATPVGV